MVYSETVKTKSFTFRKSPTFTCGTHIFKAGCASSKQGPISEPFLVSFVKSDELRLSLNKGQILKANDLFQFRKI